MDTHSDSKNSLEEKKKKLFELQLKVNQARKKNHQEVIAEDKRKNSSEIESDRTKREWEEQKKKEKEEIISAGLDPEKEKILNATASEAEWREKKRKASTEKTSFGWDQYNPDAQYNAYKRRVKNTRTDVVEYQEQKSKLGEEDFYRDANYLGYGQVPEVDPKNVDKMVNELQANIAKRKNFSRRRPHLDEHYVTYINDRNAVFNRKIARAYDKYTTEIKQNLERGTAL